jgi:anti-sigma factor RsiW
MKPETHPDFLDRIVDGEATPAELAQLEAHLASCPACRAELAAKRNLSTAIRQQASRHAAPPALLEKWKAIPSLPVPAEVNVEPRPETAELLTFRPRSRPAPPRWLGLAASIALAMLVSAGGMHLIDQQSSEADVLADELVSSHIRSLEANHLYDVQSTDQHTVKPWFAGRLSFSPPVKDLAEQGFPLLGGRLDYLGRRQVAALIYRRGGHIINLFIWPASDPNAGVSSGPTEQGYHILRWSQDGMDFWAVSDVGAGDLQSFADHFRD